MPEELTTLATIRAQAIDDLAELSADPAHTTEEDAAIWASTLAALRQLVDWCDEKLADGEPFEVPSVAKT